jgi:hypothetical protein
VGGICWLLVGVTINFPPKSPHQKLDEARALWQAKGSPNYQMDIIFGSMTFLGHYRIVVHDKQVTNIFELPVFTSEVNPAPLGTAEPKLKSDFFPKGISLNLNDYTVDGLFDIAVPKLANRTLPEFISFCSTSSVSPFISYNSEYGYIQSFESSSCPDWQIGGGLMCPRICDCYAGMRVRNFQLLPPG